MIGVDRRDVAAHRRQTSQAKARQCHVLQVRLAGVGRDARGEAPQRTASTSPARIVPVRVLIPDAAKLVLDNQFSLLVLRQLSSAPDGVGLTVMERVGARRAVCLNSPATAGARFDRDLRLSRHGGLSGTGMTPDGHRTSEVGTAQAHSHEPAACLNRPEGRSPTVPVFAHDGRHGRNSISTASPSGSGARAGYELDLSNRSHRKRSLEVPYANDRNRSDTAFRSSTPR
jgi:hypothetical protein